MHTFYKINFKAVEGLLKLYEDNERVADAAMAYSRTDSARKTDH